MPVSTLENCLAAALICTLIISAEDPDLDQVGSAKDPDPHPGPADPIPEPDPLPLNVKLNYTYLQKISKYCTKKYENFNTYDADEKDKTM
jgi:hypothetical protein